VQVQKQILQTSCRKHRYKRITYTCISKMLYTHMFKYIQQYIHAFIFIYICILLCIHIFVCIQKRSPKRLVNTRTCTYNICISIHNATYTYFYMNAGIYTYICRYTHIHTAIYSHLYMCTETKSAVSFQTTRISSSISQDKFICINMFILLYIHIFICM